MYPSLGVHERSVNPVPSTQVEPGIAAVTWASQKPPSIITAPDNDFIARDPWRLNECQQNSGLGDDGWGGAGGVGRIAAKFLQNSSSGKQQCFLCVVESIT